MGGAGKEHGGLRLQARKRSKGNTGDPGSIGHGSPVATVLSEALLTSNETVGTRFFRQDVVLSEEQSAVSGSIARHPPNELSAAERLVTAT